MTNSPVVLVTGAARRVGAEIVRTLHAAGARVAIHCRRSRAAAEDLAAWYEDIRESAPTARLLDGQFARDRVPILRRQSSVACVWDPEAADIDVARLMAALIQDFRRRKICGRC